MPNARLSCGVECSCNLIGDNRHALKHRWLPGVLLGFALSFGLSSPAFAQVLDTDGDGVEDAVDNCRLVPNGPAEDNQQNTDNDAEGDACDDDDDNDAVLDDGDGDGVPGNNPCPDGQLALCDDNCRLAPNGINQDIQQDTDADGEGDACDDGDTILDDGDGDGFIGNNPCPDGQLASCDDNCRLAPNSDQQDTDEDAQGDACDDDDDNDAIPDDGGDNFCAPGQSTDCDDNCQLVPNNNQADLDGDLLGDVCDNDADADGVLDDGDQSGAIGDNRCVSGQSVGCDDNCRLVPNGPAEDNQQNTDNDAFGDACDTDDDNDGILDDGDGDGVPGNNLCPDGQLASCDDNCQLVPNNNQADLDGDLLGDVCDDDADADGVLDDGDSDGVPGSNPCAPGQSAGCDDNCRLVPNGPNEDNQQDTDADGDGDACDGDLDGDQIPDDVDNCPEDPNTDQQNSDGALDGGDACDLDDDDDELPDVNDNCATVPGADQTDSDGDALGDICDDDDDNDAVADVGDNCPEDPNTDQQNSDGALDGGDACDPDDDDDAISDEDEEAFGTNPKDPDDFPIATGGGCMISQGKGGLGVLLLFGLFLALTLWRRKGDALPRPAPLSMTALALLFASSAWAQEAAGFDALTFRPAVQGRGGVVVEGADILKSFDLSAALILDHSFAPVELSNTEGERLSGIINQQDYALLQMGLGLFGPLELGLDLPISVARLTEPGNTFSRTLRGSGVGDALLGIKAAILPGKEGALGLAVTAELALPSGNPADLTGDGGVGAAIRFAADYRAGAVRLIANAGARLRPETGAFFGAKQSDQITFGGAVSYALIPDSLHTALEVYGARALGEGQSPLEAMFSVQKRFGTVSALVGMGVGLDDALGVPDTRIFLGFSYELRLDRDDTGEGAVVVSKDGCQDKNGCAESDRDSDGILDAADTCPEEAEDKDGFLDEDGCVENDNDQDGLADAKDSCPDEAEDKDGFLDEDGCVDVAPEYDFTTQSKIIFYDILFEPGSDKILPESISVLDAIVRSLKSQPLVKVRIEGHTDSDGKDTENLILSQARALAVLNYLVYEGIDSSRLDYAGYGETRPIANNDTPEGKKLNRRVEFLVIR